MEEPQISAEEFTRLVNNFYQSQKIEVPYERIALDSHLANYLIENQGSIKKKFKVALCCICLNAPYWPYAKEMIEGAKRFFLPGHNIDYFLWSDMLPEVTYGATVFETESVQWPMATLMRYHLFLQQEEKLAEYDYIFYVDIDMKFIGVVGDEILGEGLTVAPHPGYYIRKQLYSPFEPNRQSASYVERPGILMNDEGKPRFMPFYAAGGLVGGKSLEFIKAMKEMRKLIDKDLSKNYIPVWNDETVWNKYLFNILPKEELEKVKFLTPAYVYPDSLIKEYYIPIVWGQDFMPKLITLTKKFTVSKEGAEAVQKMIGTK